MAATTASDNANRRALAVLGAAVADAAAMPTHWIYDVVSWGPHGIRCRAAHLRSQLQARIGEVAAAHNAGELAFIPADASGGHHEGVPSYHAHTTLKTGDVSVV